MSENPYESSTTDESDESNVQSSGSPSPNRSADKIVLYCAVILAVLAGLSFLVGVPGRSELITWLVIILPAIALLIVSGNAVIRGKDKFLAPVWKTLLSATQILVVAAAGYVAFAVTCCGIGMTMIQPRTYMPPPIVGGIATFACTLLGCWIVRLLHASIRRLFPAKS